MTPAEVLVLLEEITELLKPTMAEALALAERQVRLQAYSDFVWSGLLGFGAVILGGITFRVWRTSEDIRELAIITGLFTALAAPFSVLFLLKGLQCLANPTWAALQLILSLK